MTELEKLQEQLKELKKTVDDLKSGTVKVQTLKDRLSQEQCCIFNKYFNSNFNQHDDYWFRGEYANPGYVIANEKREQCRTAIRDTAKSLYIMNHFSEYKNVGNFVFDKLLKTEEQIQEYLELFEGMCQVAVSKVENNKFKTVGIEKESEE